MTDESGNNDGNAAEFKNALDTSIQNPTAESSMQEQAISGQQ